MSAHSCYPVKRVAGTSAEAVSRLLRPQDRSHTLPLQKSASKKVGQNLRCKSDPKKVGNIATTNYNMVQTGG
jgi:hypothetical protein